MAEPTSAADNQILKSHSNAIVPHKIANHDTEAVQLNVWNGTEWVNIYDGNDMRNMNIDLHKVSKVVEKHAAEIPAVESAANSAVEQAESAVSASKVNSEAIAAQSEAISEAKSAINSATAAIQQTAANAASDAAKIRVDVAQVQSEIDANKTANSASVEALKSDISAAKQDLADVHDSLDKAQSAIEQNQKLINDNVARITSDVSATKQDLATVHDSLTKAQAAAEQNQKAIDESIAQINANVDATNQDLAGVRKDLTKAQSDIAANQKSINDNVAKINADITQDRKDIASAQQANADTAKQLDDYSKQATEQSKTIKTIQDKQDGFTATLADVQGNVSQVSDKVDGLSASLKDAQGNVASVKAQADQLSATLTDHAKNIATLTASAKELSSTLEDANGRLSKVEQTAQTNSSTLSDVQGDLSQVKQDATTLTATLKDAQGNISTLQQKADSVSAQLATAQGDIASLQTGVDGVKATLTSHDKSIHTLQADSKSLKDSMADAQGDISTLSKTATDVTSELEDHTGRLSKVEQTASKQATTLSDLQGNLSKVEQKADSNTATISSISKNAMQDRGVITDTKASFDSLTQLGTYSIKASGLSNMPEQHYGTLVVSGSAGSGWLSQQFVADTTGNVYTRVFSNNAWSAWKQGGSQDAINQVKQTADSNSATIRNVQGDVSTLKQTATGVEAALADYEGDIHTLQADDKSLKDSMADAQGDISTLSKTATSLDSEMKDHAGRLSKVEQSAATQATTLSDLQGNLTQVKQQADGLVTTLKNAQGSITQIQQKADGTLAQLKSVQGDIASLQTDVTGIKATLVSHEGDIHTLQADSKTLKDDMQDAQGDISTLKKTSTDVTSELKDHAGRISKAEQTAATLTNEFADQQGHLNRVEQTAQGTEQTVANQQGQINNIKTDVSGVHETITGQGNQIATINTSLNGLNTKYEGVSGDLNNLKSQAQWVTVTDTVDLNNIKTPCHEFLKGAVTNAPNEVAWWYLTVEGSEGNRITQTVIADQSNNRYTRRWADGWSAWVRDATQTDVTNLSNQITTNSTQITQNQQAIALKADQSTVGNLSGEVSQNTAQLKVQADQISSKVSSTDFKTLNDKFNNMRIGGRNLLLNSAGPFQPQNDGRIDNYQVFNSSTIDMVQGQQYTISGSTNGTFSGVHNPENESDNCVLWLVTSSFTVATIVSDSNTAQGTTFTWENPTGMYYLRVNTYHPASTNKIKAWNIKIEKGNVATDWTPAPEDTTTAIQSNTTAIDQTNKQISLKADQTVVDTIKTTATNNSSRLDVMNNEIQSKVTSTDVNNIINGKGYATTSTVQSLITQKAGTINESITNLTSKVNSNGGGVNLLPNSKDLHTGWAADGTSIYPVDDYLAVRATGGLQRLLINPTEDTKGKLLSVSFDACVPSDSKEQDVQIWVGPFQAAIGIVVSGSDFKRYKAENWKWNSVNNALSIQLKNVNDKINIKNIKLEFGPVATPYSPAPSDNATVTQVQEITASIDGIQSTVANKADKSQITQLSNVIQSKVSTSDFTSKVSQLSTDINARVTKGDLLSQINVEAGRTLIQSNKIYFDADSFVMSPNSKAFIPSAFITNLSADKITTGTLDAAKLHVKNFSADNISGGTLKGIDIQTSDSKSNFEITGPWIQWKSVDENKTAEEPYYLVNIGSGSTDLIAANSNAQNAINASNGKMFSIVSNHGLVLSSGMASGEDYSDPTKIIAPDYYPKLTLVGWDVGNQEATGAYIDAGKTTLELHGQFYESETDRDTEIKTRGFGLDTWNRVQFNFKHFNDGGHSGDYYNGAEFAIQKDNKLTADFGGGKNGNEINFTALGGTNIHGNFHVTGSKNSIVKTTQGYLAINAYETAEYYFGDIGESNTGASGKVIVGIDKIFNETVNTDIQYQVFLTSYGNARLWVSKRYNNRFVVESDTPNAEFGWELKAKRKGYEGNRLRVVHGDFDNPELLKGSTN